MKPFRLHSKFSATGLVKSFRLFERIAPVSCRQERSGSRLPRIQKSLDLRNSDIVADQTGIDEEFEVASSFVWFASLDHLQDFAGLRSTFFEPKRFRCFALFDLALLPSVDHSNTGITQTRNGCREKGQG